MRVTTRWVAAVLALGLLTTLAPAAYADQGSNGNGNNGNAASASNAQGNDQGNKGNEKNNSTNSGNDVNNKGQSGQSDKDKSAKEQGNAKQQGNAGASQVGNSGTIKISSVPLSGATNANNPKPGCTFYILGFGFPNATGTFSIEPQGGSNVAGTSSVSGTYGGSAAGPYGFLSQPASQGPSGRVDFQIGPISDLASGMYKARVNSDNTPGGDKQKVFKLDCPATGGTTISEENEHGLSVSKTADTTSISSADVAAGKQVTYNILVTRNGDIPGGANGPMQMRIDDTLGSCPAFASFMTDSLDSGGLAGQVGTQIQINNCTITILGDAHRIVGNLFHVKVRFTQPGGSLPSTLTNNVTATIPELNETATTGLNIPVVQSPTGNTTINAPGNTVALSPTTTHESTPTTAQVLTSGGSVPQGETVSIPAGTPILLPVGATELSPNGTFAVPGPATIEVAGETVEIPAGEVLVLGETAQREAPNTGVAGEAATQLVYTVQTGDSLESIAAWWYGDATYASAIEAANSDQLDGQDVQPGEVLVLP